MKIKIVHQNEIHLLKQQAPSFEGIQEHVKKIFPTVGNDFTLVYTDTENDQITLSCQDDLQVLIDEGVQSLKITVQPKTQQQPQQQKMVHHRYVCDGCRAHPIIGARFKCLDCPNYDLCETCQAKDIHNEHKFFKISNFEELANYKNEYEQKEKECPQQQQQGPRFPHGFPGPHGFPPQPPHGFPGPHGFPPQAPHGFPPQGPHGWGPRGGPCGGGPHQHFFKQMRELFNDPQFKEIKNNVCQVAKEAFTIIKQQMEQLQNKQNQQQETTQQETTQQETTETQQGETPMSEVQEPQIPQQQQEVVQEPQVDEKQVEFEQKVKGLAVVLDCQEGVAKEYVEMFRDLSLDEIVDIIINGK